MILDRVKLDASTFLNSSFFYQYFKNEVSLNGNKFSILNFFRLSEMFKYNTIKTTPKVVT